MFFWKNLSMYLLGVAFQVLAGIFPKLSGALIVPATLLLSAADVRTVLNGSFWKHLIILILGVLCNAGAAIVPTAWQAAAPLLAAGGILVSASDIKRVMQGPESPRASIITPIAESAQPKSGSPPDAPKAA